MIGDRRQEFALTVKLNPAVEFAVDGANRPQTEAHDHPVVQACAWRDPTTIAQRLFKSAVMHLSAVGGRWLPRRPTTITRSPQHHYKHDQGGGADLHQSVPRWTVLKREQLTPLERGGCRIPGRVRRHLKSNSRTRHACLPPTDQQPDVAPGHSGGLARSSTAGFSFGCPRFWGELASALICPNVLNFVFVWCVVRRKQGATGRCRPEFPSCSLDLRIFC